MDRRPTGYVYDPIFLKHTQHGHPESDRRLNAIMAKLKSSGLLELLEQVPSRAATVEELAYIHPVQYVERIQAISEAGGGNLDPDTYTTSDTYEAAAVAAGSLIDLTLAVIDGKLKNGFAFVRPPGHHAMPNRGMGFCIFNNVAIAARAAQKHRGIERVAIVDFDVHHGNGTQAVFEEDPGILYHSSHQYPYYPGTGALREVGYGEGKGTIINFPLPSGTGDESFRMLYNEILIPAMRRFNPQLILVSAGYDNHWEDLLASLGLSLTGQTWIAQTLIELAEELCEGKIVFTLEGGYNLNVLEEGVANSVKALLGRDDFVDLIGKSPRREPDLTEYVEEVKKIHHLQ
jgi:acetoin utilization deacetylase AcuC-like enzyme